MPILFLAAGPPVPGPWHKGDHHASAASAKSPTLMSRSTTWLPRADVGSVRYAF